MIFEYALPIMIFLVLINWRGDGSNVACIFLSTSVVFNWIISTSEGEEGFVLYAVNELVMLLIIRFSRGPERLIRDMILISIFSIAVQLLGLLVWSDYYSSSVYMTLCQVVFALQIIRLLAHGLATREIADTRRGSMDSIYTDNSGKKL